MKTKKIQNAVDDAFDEGWDAAQSGEYRKSCGAYNHSEASKVNGTRLKVHSAGTLYISHTLDQEGEKVECVVLTGDKDALRALAKMVAVEVLL